jgi:hypothetical protein
MLKQLVLIGIVSLIGAPLYAQVYGAVIEQWDFAEGLPSGWTTASDGLAQWEYRGPQTLPSNQEGSQGSCGGNSVPITSPTAANGFMMFDANFWDDPIGPCGNLGSGPDPAPHAVSITTSPMNLSDETAVVLTFYQQFNHFQTTTQVLASLDGGESWTPVFTNPTTNSSQNGSGAWASVNVSSLAANQPDVRFQFRFTGTYYWWMLDDVALYSPNQFDSFIENPKYTLYDGTFYPDGLGRMEYAAYPQAMVAPLNFSARIRNIGSDSLSNVRLQLTVTREPSTTVFDAQTLEIEELSPGTLATAVFENPFTPPAVAGNYTITYTSLQDESEESPENNTLEKVFRITPYAYAFDRGDEVEDVFVPPVQFSGLPYQIGALYEARATGPKLHGMGVAFGEGSAVGAQVTGIVYNHRRDVVYTQSEPYTLNEWDINQVGDDKVVHLTFTEPLITVLDSMYSVMVRIDDPSNGTFYVGRNGESFATGSIINFPTINQTFFLLRAPIVRAHIFPGNSSPGCLDSTAMNFNSEADTDDGSCRFPGCIYPEASNYDPNANFFDGSCVFEGCTDPEAENYDPNATADDGSCLYAGCTDTEALNFDADADLDDGSCVYGTAFLSISDSIGCAPHTVVFNNQTFIDEGGACSFFLNGELYSEECLDDFEITFNEPGEYSMVYTYIIEDIASEYTAGPIVVGSFPDAPTLAYDESQVQLQCTGCDEIATAWYFNGEPIEGASDPTWSPAASGWYSVEAMNSLGCASVSDSTFVLLPGAAASFEVNAVEGCEPFALTITNLTETEAGSACELRINGEVQSTVCQELYEISLLAGEYSIEFIHAVSDSVTTAQADVLVNPSPPAPELTEDTLDSTTLTCTNCEGLSLQWLLDGNAVPDATGPVLDTVGGGVYSLVVTNAEGCSTESDPVVVANISERLIDDTILYPNPANEAVVIRSSAPVKGWSLYGAEGRLLAAAAHPSPKNEIPLTDFAPGSYLVYIQFDEYSIVKRLVISH